MRATLPVDCCVVEYWQPTCVCKLKAITNERLLIIGNRDFTHRVGGKLGIIHITCEPNASWGNRLGYQYAWVGSLGEIGQRCILVI